MAVMRCKQCNEVCFPDDKCHPATICINCGSHELECDHPGSHFDKARQIFVCSWCGDERNGSLSRLRLFAQGNREAEIQEIIDITNH